MTEEKTFETGDKTYTTRKERFEYIQRRRAETPRPTLRVLAAELGVSHQAIGRLIKRGEVRPSGRPRTNEGRIKKLAERLDRWQQRRTRKLARGLDVSYEDANIAKVEARLAELS